MLLLVSSGMLPIDKDMEIDAKRYKVQFIPNTSKDA